jgi:hypothetical protein
MYRFPHFIPLLLSHFNDTDIKFAPRKDIKDAFLVLYRVTLVRTDVSENVSSPSSGFFGLIGFHGSITVGKSHL